MPDTIVRRAACALNPDRPIRALAKLARRPRSTAKSWASDHRRPPIKTLEALREAIRQRQAILSALIPDLNHAIMSRGKEIKRRTGFCEIDPLTGRDKRNRLGRPKRATPA
jgi:hypothetical protein